MRGRAVRPPHRELLQTGWSLCGVPSGAPAPSAEAFFSIPGPLPAAAALRALNRWALDGPAQDFDAQDWWYRVVFDALPGEAAVLGLDGLATLGQLWLNGEPLGSSDTMFVPLRFDVQGRLRPQGNELLIQCRSLQAELARRRPRPRWRAPMVAHQQLRWLRTTLLGRTPGWSPPAAVVGPWRDVWIGHTTVGDSADCKLAATVDGSTGQLHCEVMFHADDAAQIEAVAVELERDGTRHTKPLVRSGQGKYTAELELPSVALWWPHTHGEPALYRASLRLRARDGAELSTDLGRIGFRTLMLDTQGDGFRLLVNGVQVFCRGAGWTPLDPVSLRSTPQDCRDAVAQACRAGMNMLRLAGTLVYEEDHFYDACDELGVLVWQDFMFANMDYPADDPAFASSVAQEARHVLRRLRSRPCLAVLCGNSEVEQQAAMWGAPRQLWQPALFHETLPALCAEQSPAIPYWPSSAHGGAFPHQADAGTTSYYGVGAYLRPQDDARRSGLRFATECLAFANIPSGEALQRMPGGLATRAHHPQWKARSPRDLGAGWDFDDVRDHYLQSLFGIDAARLRYSNHDRYLALARLATAETMGSAYREWRRPASTCGGALVLFLRDLWAGAGWGVVDDAGQPKACWHALKRALQPLAVWLSDEGGNGLHAHVVNEHEAPRDVTLEITAWRDGETRVASANKRLALPARGAITLPCASLFDHFMDLGWAWRFGPPACDTVVATLRDAQGTELACGFHFPAGWSAIQEADVGLAAAVHWDTPLHARVAVSSRRLALGVHFDIPGFVADDEHFHLAPGAQVTSILRTSEPRPLAGSVQAINSRTPIKVAASHGGGDSP